VQCVSDPEDDSRHLLWTVARRSGLDYNLCMTILAIKKYPSPELTTRATEVDAIDDELRELIQDMVETMYAAPGVGLAANQVGVAKRVAVIDLSAGEEPGNLHVLINPEIVEASGEQCDEEGCLSFPGVTEMLTRPQRVVMRALDLDGKIFTVTGEDLMARAICHEVDHLDGVLFMDRLTGFKKDRVRKEVRRSIKSGDWAEVYP
jgi:peptide deformylase